MPGVRWSKDEAKDEGRPQPVYESKSKKTQDPAQITAARDLDHKLDAMLDEAADLRSRVSNPRAGKRFTPAWAFGAALSESQISEHEALKGEDEDYLWSILADKMRAGVRSDGTSTTAWESSRPPTRKERTQREGSKKGDDHWAMCTWLAEQSYADAYMTFGGNLRNVWQMLERKNLRPLVVREALCGWLGDLSEEGRAHLTHNQTFPELMKALVKRWPAKGPRSALQPIHLGVDELRAEIARVAWEAGILATTRDSS